MRTITRGLEMNGKTALLTPISNHNWSFPRKSYIDPVILSIFQRILLTNNGTITDLIETYTGESIKVKKLSEEITELEEEHRSLHLNPGSPIVDRKILLQGGISGRNYVYAESIIALDRLDEPIREELLTSKKPIGKVWLENKVEIFKENIETGREPAQELAHYFDIAPNEYLLFRTYCVLSNRQYTMMITEKFPESYFMREF